MGRKSKYTTKARLGVTRRLSTSLARKHTSIMKFEEKAGLSNPSQIGPGSSGSGKTAASITSSNEEADGSNSDGAEADLDDDDEEDADEMAPSDTIIQNSEDQTGHKIEIGMKSIANIGEPHKCSPDNTANEERRASRRKAPKSTRQMKGKNADSDEDDYNGVDLISDSEEEEPTVEQLEEKVIIESEEEYDGSCKTPPILPSISSDGWTGFDLEGDLFLSDVPYFDEQIGRTDPSILAEEIEIFNSTSFSQGFYDVELPPRLTPPRRVRFAEDVQKSDKSSAVVSDMEQNHNQGYGSFGLDDGQEGAGSANQNSEDDDADSSSGRSSGYETDLGETTEEEDVPASATTRPQSLLRRTSMSSLQGDAQITPTPRRRLPPPNYRWGPTMGSWIADPTKPMAIVDSTGTRLVIYPPQRPQKRNQFFASLGSSAASSANSSPRPSMSQLAIAVDDSEAEPSARSSQDPVSPMFGSSPNLMMSGLVNVGPGSEHLTGGQVLGPPEAFFPFTNFDAGGNVIMDEDDDEDEDDLLNLDDFIDFGEDTDGSDHEGAIAEPHSPSASSMTSGISATPKPAKMSSATPSTPSLMDHLDKGVVTAFRRSQYNHRPTQRRPSKGSLQRVNAAFKGGRRAAADPPLSPLKKRRLSDAFDVEKGANEVAVKRRSLTVL